jgi:type VI protein secretion system component Hcp
MPIYMRILQNGTPIPATTGSAHKNGMEILGIAWGSPSMAPSVNEVVVTKEFDAGSPKLFRPSTGDTLNLTNARSSGPAARQLTSGHRFTLGRHFDADAPSRNDPDRPVLIAQIAFTRADRSGGEITDLRVQLHGVQIVRSEHAVQAGRAAPVERIAIRYSKMTQAGVPESAPDVSHQVRARVIHEAQIRGWEHSYEFRAGKWV